MTKPRLTKCACGRLFYLTPKRRQCATCEARKRLQRRPYDDETPILKDRSLI